MGTGRDHFPEDNVLPMRTRTSARIDRIETYWNSVRGKRLVPSRCEIDPRGLDGVLSHAFVLERITGGLARFRIAGSHLRDISGLELRQMPLSALFLPGSRDILGDALTAVFDEPAVVRMGISSPVGFLREELTGELILLPLRSDLGDIDRVLGGLVLDGPTGRSPRRIEITGQARKSLTGFAGSTHLGTSAVDAARPDVAPRANPATPRGLASRGHLRLVVSNDSNSLATPLR